MSSAAQPQHNEDLAWLQISLSLMESLIWLQRSLQRQVTGKTTLVVLDDVWDENFTTNSFDTLLTALNLVAPGSTIILTTHNEDIAKMLHPNYTLHLEELPDADCRHLFKMRAFGNPHKAEDEDEEAIITTIVAKCKGLPLAIRVIGDLVSKSSNSIDALQTYARSNIWDLALPEGILPSLYLTYLHLPPELRRCFAYCSIFPKNYRFDKDKLILLWMAEGFIVQEPHDTRRMEDVGNMYFNTLLARSFFQVSATKSQFFVMHDSIHDLAVYLFRAFGFMLKSEVLGDDIMENPRHFSFMQSKYDTLESFCLNDGCRKHLRTFLPVRPYSIGVPYLSNELLQSLKDFSRLRVLSLCNYRITSIPATIGNLKHLRYLDFSSTLIEELPKTICKLSNLQTLLLFRCQYLRRLPTMMKNLIHLRHLDIRGTLRLQEMPDHVGSLRFLQTLTDFVIGEGHKNRIRDLGKLELRGSLHIKRLENAIDKADAFAANLRDKTFLDEIALHQSHNVVIANREHDQLLDVLKPPTSLKSLTISVYEGEHFPNWLGYEAFRNLMVLNLEWCPNCIQLPPLGKLPSLRDLKISCLDNIETLGPEFYGEHWESSPFKSLVRLSFGGLRCWRNWLPYDGDVMPFPSLQKLYMWDCVELEAEIPLKLPSLIVLDVRRCKKIRGSLPQSPNLQELRLADFGELELPNLADLNLLSDLSLSWHMRSRENHSISQVQSTLPLSTSLENVSLKFMTGGVQRQWRFPHLIRMITIENCGDQEIDIEDCKNIQSFKISGSNSIVKLPTGNRKILNYVELTGVNGRSVLQVIHEGNRDGLESLYDLSICQYEILHYPNLLLTARNLITLSLRKCTGLSSLPTGMAAHYPCLQFLSVVKCNDLTSILEDEIPAQLQTLEIKHCQNLVSFPERMYTCMSLQRLVVKNCTGLASLPENILPPNLRELHCDLAKLNHYYEKWKLNRLTSLRKLRLSGLTETQSFPAGGSLPTSLTVLSLINFRQLRSINCSELQRIPRLRELEIFDCPELRSFTEGDGLPQSLCRLTIKGSPLAARCRYGHYANMASCITCLQLDGD